MDCWGECDSPAEHLAKSKWILDTFLPWEAERAKNVELTDANGILAGRFAPTVRKPIARLPSGKAVFGMADVVVLNDPITGQGSNNASKCAKIYLDSILAHGDKPFDQAWMQATFDRFWDYVQYVTGWTNALLQPPPPHVLNIMGAAQGIPGSRHAASPIASTSRWICSPGSRCRKKPTSISNLWPHDPRRVVMPASVVVCRGHDDCGSCYAFFRVRAT